MMPFRFQLIVGRRFCLAVACLLWFGAPAARALEHYVIPYNTSQANPYTGWATAGTNLIDVVNAAMTNPGPTRIVWVTNGTYLLTNQVNITNGVTVTSVGGVTVVDGNNYVDKPVTNCCFTLNHAGAVLDGFTITKGRESYGAGVRLLKGTMQNCIVISNTVYNVAGFGGGVYISGGTGQSCTIAYNTSSNGGGVQMGGGTLQSCTIANNVATNGGGVYKQGGGTLQSCMIASNTAFNFGGGAYLTLNQQIISCTNDGNTAVNRGGGLFMSGANITASNCTLINNKVTVAGGTHGGGGAYVESGGKLINCSISNNAAGPGYGGGAALLYGGSCAINCVISSNRATYGGGLELDAESGGVQLMATNCLIQGNAANNGGAIYIYAASVNTMWAVIANCSIIGNTANGAGGLGGGVYYAWGGEFRNCLFAYNTAVGAGGGAYLGIGGMMANCTIASNWAGSVGGLVAAAGTTATGTVQNTIIYMNTSTNAGNTYSNYIPSYVWSYSNSCFAPAQTGAGTSLSANNITSDPRFINQDDGNFRLVAGSPCINAGVNRDWMTNGIDRDLRPRLDRYSGIVDMGCYEHIPSGTMYGVR